VAAGDRAEVYRSYEGMPRNFLGYRQLRLWALAREGRWGTGEGGEQLVIRVGSGPDNFYLYRTPLQRVGAPLAPQDWGPEIVIDFAPWQRLRAEAERLLLERPVGDTQPLMLWDADSTYAVVVGERGRAPNLAAIRELSLAVWNSGGGMAAGELWINDLRLAAAESRPGAAGELNLAIRGGGVLQTDLTYVHQGAHFRQLDALPGYQGEGMLSLSSALQLGELLPGGWGLHAPLAVSHQRTAAEPLYVERTDLDASMLGAVRRPEGQRTRVSFQLGRRAAGGGTGVGLAAAEGLRLRVAYQSADEATPYTALRGEDLDVGVEYHIRPAARTLRLLPESAGGVGWLPSLLRGALLGSSLPGLRLRWSPESFTLSTGWSDRRSEYQSFSHVLLSESDGSAGRQSLQQRLHQQASLQLRPFPSLGGDLMLRSTRDLLPSTLLNAQAAERLDAERLRLAGLDLGREADRSLTTRLTWAPRVSEWLTAQATASGSFVLDQNPGYYREGPHPLTAAPEQRPHPLAPSPMKGEGEQFSAEASSGAALQSPLPLWERGASLTERGEGTEAEAGPTPVLLRTFGNNRALSTRFVLDPQKLARAIGGAAVDSAARLPTWRGWLLHALQPLEVGWGRVLESRFDRAAGSPGLGYQFGLGGRDDFRTLHADSATRLLGGTELTLRTGLALPTAARLRLGYGARRGELLGRRSERFDRETTWPDLALEWSSLPLPDLVRGAVRNVAFSTGYNLRSHGQADRGAGEERVTRTDRLPLSISAVWQGGIVTAYRAEWLHGRGETPFASTERMARDQSLSLGGPLPTPGFLAPAFPEPVSIALRYTQGDRRECRLSAELTGCSARNEFLSYEDRVVGLQLDTRAGGMSFGLQLDHRDRRDRIGERGANSQFTFGLFGQFNLTAGTVP
ncbi:MAG: hypothetical protein ACR2H9_04030, partial [Longimicrobiaceae bacterium]